MGGGAGRRIGVVDTTLRDGQLSLWATRMRTGMMLPIAERLDAAGFDAIEVIGSSFFKVCVRELREDPWERLRLLAARLRRTPLRTIKTRHISAFQPTPPAVQRLWMRRLAANGVRQVRISDPSNNVANLRQEVARLRRAGLEAIVNLIYTISPRHTDEDYAQRARALAGCGARHLCLKDPSGLLTPERTGTLISLLRSAWPGRPVELHTHCNTGLGPLCCLAALRAGASVVDTAIPPLANGASQPSVFNFLDNAATLGFDVRLDRQALRAVEAHLLRIAQRDGLARGVPAEYRLEQYRRQIPGGMVSNFRGQLRELGMEARLDEVLEEMVRVRAEFGYPIMVTPYAQYVGTQAFVNVVGGERYVQATDDVIRYALGQWGREEADGMDAGVRDRILARPRAAELAAQAPRDVSVRELRRRMGAGTSVDDDEWLLRYLTSASDVARMRAAGPVVEDRGDGSSLVDLVRGLAAASRFRSIHVCQDGISLTLRRGLEEVGPS